MCLEDPERTIPPGIVALTGITDAMVQGRHIDEARVHADRACQHAGDGGYARLRVMALLMRARVTGDQEDLTRAHAIARRLGDDELLRRVAVALPFREAD